MNNLTAERLETLTPRDAIDPRSAADRQSRHRAVVCVLVFVALVILLIARLTSGLDAT